MKKYKRSQGRSVAFVAAFGTQPVQRGTVVAEPPKPRPTITAKKVNTSKLTAEQLAFLAEKDKTERKVCDIYCTWLRENTEIGSGTRMAIAIAVSRDFSYQQYQEATEVAGVNTISQRCYERTRRALSAHACPYCGGQHHILDGCY